MSGETGLPPPLKGTAMYHRTRWLAPLLAVVVQTAPAVADKPVPVTSYKREVPGGPFVFVMIMPVPLEEEVATFSPAQATEVRAVRRVYSQSGLYPDDGTTKPLWTVNWYAPDVEVASDGIHMVRIDRGAPLQGAVGAHAISFYANGVLLQTYTVGDLIGNLERVPHSVTRHLWIDRGELDNARLEYKLTTAEGRRYVFDLRTGSTTVAPQGVPLGSLAIAFAVVGGAGVLAVVMVLGGWLWRRRLKRMGSEASTG